jgi:hypothetical protein
MERHLVRKNPIQALVLMGTVARTDCAVVFFFFFFRLALEECWNSKPYGPSVPFTIASLFVRNVTRQKSAIENVLAAQEKLT